MAALFDHRIATTDDLTILTTIMDRAMRALLSPFLTPGQVEASHAVMGLDTQLVSDGTYFLITADGAPAGCGGWSRRATFYGGDHSQGRDAALLDPAVDPARVRAMYTDPAFTRQGVGRLILTLCEQAARAEGFCSVALVATMPGLPLYEACGYTATEFFEDASGGDPVPLARMTKPLQLP
jgi:GNAT superfamily N-acetyltransferase